MISWRCNNNKNDDDDDDDDDYVGDGDEYYMRMKMRMMMMMLMMMMIRIYHGVIQCMSTFICESELEKKVLSHMDIEKKDIHKGNQK